MKRWIRWVGFAISLTCITFFIVSAAPHWHAVSTAHWTARIWLLVALALCAYIVTYASATLAWQFSLRITGRAVEYAKLARILLLSQLAKYLPGNIGHHVGRVVLAKRIGLSIDTVVVSMAIDTMILMGAAVACSVPAFALILSLLRQQGASHGRIALAALALLSFVLVALSLVPVARREILRHIRLVVALCHRGALRLFVQGWLIHSLAFLLGATALYLLCSALEGSFSATWLSVLGVYTAAWLLGFVMPGAPAGLGIREVALLVGLTPLYGGEQAMAAAATLRLVTVTGDGLVFLFALVRWRGNDQSMVI